MAYPFDISSMLRRRNIFDGSPTVDSGFNNSAIDFTPPPNSNAAVDSSDNGGQGLIDIWDRIASAKPGPAQQAYKDFLSQNEPDTADYQPSKTQRLAAILAGINNNFSRGGGQGAAVTQSMLDQPYNRAMLDYKNKAARYKEAADTEEKDISNRVKTYRDFIQDQTAARNAAETHRVNNARIANYESQIRDRDAEMKTKGWTATTNNLTGNRIYQRPNGQGGVDTIDSGVKVTQTPQDKLNMNVKQHGIFSGIDLGRQQQLFDFTQPKREQTEKNLIDYREKKELSKEERANLEWASRQVGNPQRQFAQRALAYVQVHDEHPELDINLTNFTSDDPQVTSLVNAKIKQMNANVRGTTTTTTRDSRIEGVK